MMQKAMEAIPVITEVIRNLVLILLFVSLWKNIVSGKTDGGDKLMFAGVFALLTIASGVPAILRFPMIGAGIVFYSVRRRKCSAAKMAFLLLLLYNIHAMAFLLSDCLYNLMVGNMESLIDMESPAVVEQIYAYTAVAMGGLMAGYTLLAGIFLKILKKTVRIGFEMEWRDFAFLSVMNVIGIVFTYMVMEIAIISYDTGVFVLFDEKRGVLWKIPMVACLILAGEFSSVWVWQKYRVLLLEKEDVLLYESRLKQMKERLDEADSFYGSLRTLKHDIRNHISNIRNLNAKGDYESADAYIDKINRTLDEMDFRFSTGNSVCDVVVNDKYRVCEREGIAFSSGFEFYDGAGVASFDMGVLLGNLLDNAIEGCRAVESGERFIELKSKIKGAFVILEIRNSCVGEVVFDEEDGLPVSTKTKSGGRGSANGAEGVLHGIGIRSSRRLAEKYLGDLKAELDGNVFTVVVMLQMNCPVDTR